MKKFIATLLSMLILCSLFVAGCSSSDNGTNQSDSFDNGGTQNESNLSQEMEYAQESLLCLYSAYVTICETTNAIYSAWGYAIYYASSDCDYAMSYPRDHWDEAMIERFMFRTKGMNNSTLVREAFVSVCTGNDALWQYCLEDFNYTISIAKKYCELASYMSNIERYIQEAKSFNKNLTDTNAAKTHKTELINLCAIISSYYDMAKSPSGNYSSYGSNKSSYENNIETQYNILEAYIY